MALEILYKFKNSDKSMSANFNCEEGAYFGLSPTMKVENKLNLIEVASVTIVFTILFSLMLSLPSSFVYVEFGRYIGPLLPIVFFALIIIAVYYASKKAPLHFTRLMTENEYADYLKGRNKKETKLVIIGLCLSVLIILGLCAGFINDAQQNSKTIDEFVYKNENESLSNYVGNLTNFLYAHLQCCYNKPEMLYKTSEIFDWYSLFSSWMLSKSGVNQADVILVHGWGACGEAAIVLEQIMHDSGYQTRLAEFKDADHEWAEVKNGTQWLIVDPWYLGNLVNIQTLKNLNSESQHASGVQVQYYGSTTWIDDSKDHGY